MLRNNKMHWVAEPQLLFSIFLFPLSLCCTLSLLDLSTQQSLWLRWIKLCTNYLIYIFCASSLLRILPIHVSVLYSCLIVSNTERWIQLVTYISIKILVFTSCIAYSQIAQMIAKRVTDSKQYYSGFKSRLGRSSKWKISSNNERRNTLTLNLKFPHNFIARLLIRPWKGLSHLGARKRVLSRVSKWFKILF
jgi:hypothetical protein